MKTLWIFLIGITSLTKPKLRVQWTKPGLVAVPVPFKQHRPINPALNNLQLTISMVKKGLKITLMNFSTSAEEMNLTNSNICDKITECSGFYCAKTSICINQSKFSKSTKCKNDGIDQLFIELAVLSMSSKSIHFSQLFKIHEEFCFPKQRQFTHLGISNNLLL